MSKREEELGRMHIYHGALDLWLLCLLKAICIRIGKIGLHVKISVWDFGGERKCCLVPKVWWVRDSGINVRGKQKKPKIKIHDILMGYIKD